MNRCLWFLLLLVTITSSAIAQSDEALSKQRVVLVYNFAQQIGWPNEASFSTFKIGVLGDDPIYEDLIEIKKQGRTVRGKSISLKKLSSIGDIEGLQLVFVNKKFNYNIERILHWVKGSNTLVIGEGYGFNQSMINMIEIDRSFHFEMNETLLNREEFIVSRTLKNMAISTSDRWHQLYENSKKSLVTEQVKVKDQRAILEEQGRLLAKQRKQIQEQVEEIDSRNVKVEKLLVEYESLLEESETISEECDREMELLDKLRTQLDSQRIEIYEKRREILNMDSTLAMQQKQLDDQSLRIKYQRAILSEQRAELNYQRNFSILLGMIAIAIFVAGFFIWLNYKTNKKATRELSKKNLAIEIQKKELEAKNVEMEQFAYVASHDLQEPLNSITGLSKLISGEELDEENQRLIGMIEESTTRMRNLIKGLLEYSQLGTDVEFVPVNCEKVVRNVLANLARVIDEKGAIVEIDRLPAVSGHEIQLTSLFQNLIGNALKFTNTEVKPLILVQAERVAEEGDDVSWRFEVKDNGIGIEEKYQERIFTIFKRLHSRSEYEGTGIGLAHCKKIVDNHGGDIWLESESGVGTSFFFTLKGV